MNVHNEQRKTRVTDLVPLARAIYAIVEWLTTCQTMGSVSLPPKNLDMTISNRHSRHVVFESGG